MVRPAPGGLPLYRGRPRDSPWPGSLAAVFEAGDRSHLLYDWAIGHHHRISARFPALTCDTGLCCGYSARRRGPLPERPWQARAGTRAAICSRQQPTPPAQTSRSRRPSNSTAHACGRGWGKRRGDQGFSRAIQLNDLDASSGLAPHSRSRTGLDVPGARPRCRAARVGRPRVPAAPATACLPSSLT